MKRQSERRLPVNTDRDHITPSSLQALRVAVLKVMLVRTSKTRATRTAANSRLLSILHGWQTGNYEVAVVTSQLRSPWSKREIACLRHLHSSVAYGVMG